MNDELHGAGLRSSRRWARNRFYASMSHQLRTPINAVIGWLIMLEQRFGPPTPNEGRSATLAQGGAHLLSRERRSISSIEAGRSVSLQPVMFPALIEDLFVTVRPLAEYGSTLGLKWKAVPSS
jgi:signal transduction histidine kinase